MIMDKMLPVAQLPSFLVFVTVKFHTLDHTKVRNVLMTKVRRVTVIFQNFLQNGNMIDTRSSSNIIFPTCAKINALIYNIILGSMYGPFFVQLLFPLPPIFLHHSKVLIIVPTVIENATYSLLALFTKFKIVERLVVIP